ncbi:hypothetical protein AB0O91_01565 [Kitasatospora sp. NPDC089797]|uniref:hypothetical protein n=1 Tax=Kitasatospora sp. NPDC089797 TaxID=3155298 RepID=UPI0034410FC7
MKAQLLAVRTDRSRQIAALAATSWLPPWVVPADGPGGVVIALWCLLLALTVLPLCRAGFWAFRRTCLTVGGVLLGLELLAAVPTQLLALPFLVVLFPAGALLLLAGRMRGGPLRTGLAALLTAVPFVGAVGLCCHPH